MIHDDGRKSGILENKIMMLRGIDDLFRYKIIKMGLRVAHIKSMDTK